MMYIEDRRDSYGLTHNMGMSTHQWKEVEAQLKAKPGCFWYVFPTVYFIMMTCFFLASIQTPYKASHKFHFKIFNRLSQTLQFPQNIGWTIKGIMFIQFLQVMFVQSTIINKIQYKIYIGLYIFFSSIRSWFRNAIMQVHNLQRKWEKSNK